MQEDGDKPACFLFKKKKSSVASDAKGMKVFHLESSFSTSFTRAASQLNRLLGKVMC